MAEQYLSADELREMTGARSHRKQMAWLEARGVPFRYSGRAMIVLRAIAQELEVTPDRRAPELHPMLR